MEVYFSLAKLAYELPSLDFSSQCQDLSFSTLHEHLCLLELLRGLSLKTPSTDEEFLWRLDSAISHDPSQTPLPLIEGIGIYHVGGYAGGITALLYAIAAARPHLRFDFPEFECGVPYIEEVQKATFFVLLGKVADCVGYPVSNILVDGELLAMFQLFTITDDRLRDPSRARYNGPHSGF